MSTLPPGAPDPVARPSDSVAPRTASRWRVPAVQGVVTVVLFALAGAGAGLAWWRLWSPAPPGIVVGGDWFPLPPVGSASLFEATAWYVVVCAAGGVVVGLVVGLVLDREEAVTLVAVLLGSVLAAWVAYRVGLALSPPDPSVAAAAADDGTRLDGAMDVSGSSPFLAFPIASLLGLAISLFGVVKRPVEPVRSQD